MPGIMFVYALLRHAFSNLFRNARRSVMILLIIASSFGILYVVNCYLDQMYAGMRMGYIYGSGALQIARKGYWDVTREGYVILERNLQQKIEAWLDHHPDVEHWNREIVFQGLVGTALRSSVVNGCGVDPGKEGGYAGYVALREGEKLDETDTNTAHILIGSPLAKKLGVSAGEYVTLMATTVDGSLNLVSAQVTGIVDTYMEQMSMYFMAGSVSFIQQALQTDGIDRYLVFLKGFDDERELQRFKKDITAFIEAEHLPLEIRDWKDLNPFYFELKTLYDAIFWFVKAIIVIFVVLSIAEIISMAFFERFRELGTLRAIGQTSGEVFLMLLAEVGWYVVGGIACGLVGGYLVMTGLNAMDLQWTPPGGTSQVPFRFLVTWSSAVVPLFIVALASLVATVFPAWRSANKKVIEELRYE